MTGIQSVLARVSDLQARLGVVPPPGAFDEHLHAAASRLEVPPARQPNTAPVTLAGHRNPLRVPSAAWSSQLPDAAAPFLEAIEDAAALAGIDPRMLAAVAWAESTFVPDAVSHAGAIGLTQLMPTTAEALRVDPWDPVQNLAGGARYLKEQMDRFGSPELMLAAYNAGPGAVARAGGIPDIAETQRYVPRVLDYYRRLGGNA